MARKINTNYIEWAEALHEEFKKYEDKRRVKRFTVNEPNYPLTLNPYGKLDVQRNYPLLVDNQRYPLDMKRDNMILNKVDKDLEENNAYYDLLNKGITENYRRYSLDLRYLEFELDIKLEDIEQVNFYKEHLIIFFKSGNAHLIRYDNIRVFSLYKKTIKN